MLHTFVEISHAKTLEILCMLVYWTYWTYNYICTHLSYGTWTVDIGLWTMDREMWTVDR